MPQVKLSKPLPVKRPLSVDTPMDPVDRLVVEFPELVEKIRNVRFNAAAVVAEGREGRAAVRALYVERPWWEALGSPTGVRITIEPLPPR